MAGLLRFQICQALGGDLVNAGGGAFIINPLQFKSVPKDEESEIDKLYTDDDGRGISKMALSKFY